MLNLEKGLWQILVSSAPRPLYLISGPISQLVYISYICSRREFCQVFGDILTHGLTVPPKGGANSLEFSSIHTLLSVVICMLPQAVRFCQSLWGAMNCNSEACILGTSATQINVGITFMDPFFPPQRECGSRVVSFCLNKAVVQKWYSVQSSKSPCGLWWFCFSFSWSAQASN